MNTYIYQKLRVWCIKAYRFVKFGFRKVRHHSNHIIFTEAVHGVCDYCGEQDTLVVLEADYEVYMRICANCLDKGIEVINNHAV